MLPPWTLAGETVPFVLAAASLYCARVLEPSLLRRPREYYLLRWNARDAEGWDREG
jgi:hypothetical protein